MLVEIEQKRDAVAAICRLRRVKTLDLFGSATGTAFDPSSSDLDFLVRFQPMTAVEYAECYFGLLEDLESMFSRVIDLVELAPIQNPYFLQEIGPTRVPLYGD